MNGPTVRSDRARPISRTSRKIGIEHDDPPGRHAAIHRPRAQPRLRHDLHAAGRSRCRPATSSANTAARAAADREARGTTAGIKNPAVDTLIEQDHLRHGPRRADRRDARRSTACSCGTTTWSRSTLRRLARRPLGPLRPSRDHAGILHRLPDDLVVGRGEGRKARRLAMSRFTRRTVLTLAGAAARRAGALARAAACAAGERARTACRSSAT